MKKIFCLLISIFFLGCNNSNNMKVMKDFVGKSFNELIEYANMYNITLNETYEYSDTLSKDLIISQSILPNTKLEDEMTLDVIVSKGIDYAKHEVNELGNVPILMYHGIHDVESNYIGGNVDKDGYQRTASAFRSDLEFYYNNNYRMIRLNDYVNGSIDVSLGCSPLILTFDDGLSNNIKVTGLDDKGNIIIDPNSAVGILEEFKNKYPDFNVTATFFVNGGLFNQSEYNEKIIKWLIDNGYDVGNHTYSHADFTSISSDDSVREVAKIYQMLDKIIPNKYVNIVALPFGSPYDIDHKNFEYIVKGTYDDYSYQTISTLRVGWEAEVSPFSNDFNPLFLKRIRAYDNNGVEFDIEMNFEILENNRYISDGNKDTIVIKESDSSKLNTNYNLEVIKY